MLPGQSYTITHDCGPGWIVISHSVHREEARLNIVADYAENDNSRVVVVVQNVDNHFGVVWMSGRCRTRTQRLF